jgi:hypothetical protein
LSLLAATILEKEGLKEAAMRHLEEVYWTTEDERTRAEVGDRLRALKAELDFVKEERERAQFEKQWKETLPYAPSDFFVIVGVPPSPRLDLEQLTR